MSTLRMFATDEIHPTAWANGHGFSRELACWPGEDSPSQPTFAVRVSLESPTAPGPLPTLAGYEHLIAPIDAAGLRLGHGSDAHDTRLRAGETTTFPGDWCTHSIEPAPFLSVVTRRTQARATLHVLRLGRREVRESLTSALGMLYVTAGGLSARATNEDEPFHLNSDDGIWFEDAQPGDEWALVGETPDAEFVWIQIETPRTLTVT